MKNISMDNGVPVSPPSSLPTTQIGSNKKRVFRGVLASVFILGITAFIVGAVCFHARTSDLTVRPPEMTQESLPRSTSKSQIGASIYVPYAPLVEELNAKTNVPFQASGADTISKEVILTPEMSGDWPWPARGGWRVPAVTGSIGGGYNWDIAAHRVGSAQVVKFGDGLRASVEIAFNAHGGIRGDIARLFSLNQKNADGSIVAFVDLRPTLSPEWELTLNSAIGFDWRDKARIQLFGSPVECWVEIAGQLEKPLRQMLAGVNLQAAKLVPRDVVKKAMEAEWKYRVLPLGDVNGQAASVAFVPKEIAFSGIEYGSEGMTFAVQLTSSTEVFVGIPPPTVPSSPLPNLSPLKQGSDSIQLELPVSVSYEVLRDAAKRELANGIHADESPLGKADVAVDDVVIYPTSGGAAVIGLKVNAKFERKLFSVGGWIYLTAKPVIDEKTQMVSLEQVRFTQQLDSEIWKAIFTVVETPVRLAVSRFGKYSLRPQIAQSRSKLQEALQQVSKTGPVKIALSAVEVGLSRVNLAGKQIVIEANFKGVCRLEIQRLQP